MHHAPSVDSPRSALIVDYVKFSNLELKTAPY